MGTAAGQGAAGEAVSASLESGAQSVLEGGSNSGVPPFSSAASSGASSAALAPPPRLGSAAGAKGPKPLHCLKASGPTGPLKVSHMGTQFFAELTGRYGYDFDRVQRWRQKGWGADADVILIPIHSIVLKHWYLIAMEPARKRIHLFDSLVNRGKETDYRADMICTWYEDASGGSESAEGWDCYIYLKGVPQQTNNFDCGLFMYSIARCIVQGRTWDFSQADMPLLRRRLALSILESAV